jgi:ribosomal protein S18 acetylase RimI-like enzyme
MGHDRLMRPAEKPATAHPQIVPWTAEEFATRVEDAMRIYAAAMSYPPHAAVQRAVTGRRHAFNTGFGCRAAVLGDGTLVGFGYGYTTRAGQWWHDLVQRALPPESGRWLTNAFELSELHVLPDYQGHGIGRVLLTDLAAAIPHDAMLLSTPDADTRAFRMYRGLGFVDLRRHYLFPGDARPFAVLGARLPLPRDAH